MIFFSKISCFIADIENIRFLYFLAELLTKKVHFHESSWSVLRKHMGAESFKNDPAKNHGSYAFNVVSLRGIQTKINSAYGKNEALAQRLHVFQDL